MSRALESDSQTPLSSSKHLNHKTHTQEIYHALTNILCAQPPTLLEIEFLGKAHALPDGCHVLVDGNSVAIPKAKLVQAFVYARGLFFDEVRGCLGMGEGKGRRSEEDEEKEEERRSEEIFRTTAIMLLMDAEHLTAANARKRRLLLARKNDESDDDNDDDGKYVVELKRELLFVDSYLTSRLHRHTKSPTLWSHRKWLLEQCRSAGIVWDDLERKRLVSTVLIAAERHARNYYAWLHLRWLVGSGLLDSGGQGSSSDVNDESSLLEVVKEWALGHPADTSGFSFLMFLLDHGSLKRGDMSVKSVVVGDVLARTVAFDWTHESVWVFLRTCMAGGGCEEQIPQFLEVAAKLIQSDKLRAAGTTKVVEKALSWYRDNTLIFK